MQEVTGSIPVSPTIIKAAERYGLSFSGFSCAETGRTWIPKDYETRRGSLWIPGSCSKNAFNEEFQERFAPFSHVVHEFKKAQIEREFFL
jgi:hypothetical protein